MEIIPFPIHLSSILVINPSCSFLHLTHLISTYLFYLREDNTPTIPSHIHPPSILLNSPHFSIPLSSARNFEMSVNVKFLIDF